MAVQKKRRDAFWLICLALIVGHAALSYATIGNPWWSLGVQTCAANFADCNNCENTDLFSLNQQRLCRERGDTELVRAMSRGTLECIRDCQRQFSGQKWNCTTFQGDYLFGRFTEDGTRETAMLNAFLSAGAVHGIASACHQNVIDGCECETTPTERVGDVTYLHTCEDNVDFAIDFMKTFTGLENATGERDLVDKWNNDLGYKAVDNTSTYCRCTGLSGSCVLQTCYKKAPSVEDIGNKLQQRYGGSQRVVGTGGRLVVPGRDSTPIPNLPCYLNETPDLCVPSPNDGILGISGRKCDPLSSSPNVCNELCCGPHFHEDQHTVMTEDCKFEWCCEIVCRPTGNVTITEYWCD